MARVVLGVAASHTPQLSSPPELWADHAIRDASNRSLIGSDGRPASFESLARHAAGRFDAELAAEVWTRKFERCQAALERLRVLFAQAHVDAVVVIGDDQFEMFRYDCLPAIAVFCGDELWDFGIDPDERAALAPSLSSAMWAYHADEPQRYETAGEFGSYLVAHLTAVGFDVAQVREQQADRGLGHAFTFPRLRMMMGCYVPMVPVFLNTYYPPNQPSPGRCFGLGESIAEAIDGWNSHDRVAVIASGGLSHFVVDEDFDRSFIDSLRRRDVGQLSALPAHLLQAGTSEVLNWIVLAGATQSLEMSLLDYVPGYRSPAGTGVGMCFAAWISKEGM